MKSEIPSLTRGMALRASKMFLLAAFFVSLALYLYYSLETGKIIRIIEEKARLSTHLAVQHVDEQLSEVVADLRTVDNLPELAAYLTSPGPVTLAGLQGAFRNFVDAKRCYDQVRYLDASGMEVVRVNFGRAGAEVVPGTELQEKAGRYYFKDTFALNRGGVFISPFDLNVEHDEIEQPLKPTLRAGCPVFDGAGRKRGVVVLNYLGARLLQSLDGFGQGHDGRMMLVNEDGYWLKGLTPREEWGFMYPDRRDLNLGRRWPELWSSIQEVPSGQKTLGDGLYTFERVSPFGDVLAGSGKKDANWIAVSWLPASELSQAAGPLLRSLFLVGGLLLLVVAPGCLALVWVSDWRKSTERALRDRDKLYRTLAENFPNGVVMLMEPDLSCVLAEGRGLERFGLDKKRLQGKHLAEVFPPETANLIRDNLLKALQGEEVDFELAVGDAYFQSYVVPVFHEQGGLMAEMLMVHDITERKQLERTLESAARVDPLTGLLNRRRFDELMGVLLGLARRYETPLCLCLCDLDRFKNINDTYGHATGDDVLVRFGRTLQSLVRQTDHVVRFGGDEFGILFPQTGAEPAMEVVERIRVAVSHMRLEDASGHAFSMTGSFGVACLEPGMTAEELLAAADQALYASKRAGRDRVSLQPERPRSG